MSRKCSNTTIAEKKRLNLQELGKYCQLKLSDLEGFSEAVKWLVKLSLTKRLTQKLQANDR